jgi:hypothetical protein
MCDIPTQWCVYDENNSVFSKNVKKKKNSTAVAYIITYDIIIPTYYYYYADRYAYRFGRVVNIES